jgi:peptide-methionine (R)-S-oxide reductase
MTRPAILTRIAAFLAAIGASASPRAACATDPAWNLTDAEWHARLSPAAFAVMRQQGTEYAFSSPLDHEKRSGTYDCAGCDQALFASKTKYDSGTGWPSFYDHLPNSIAESVDRSLIETRTEVHCSRCGGHLGHVFNDGPRPTGLRYCMNGVALKFKPES